MIKSRSKYEADHLYWWYILFQVQWHICNQKSPNLELFSERTLKITNKPLSMKPWLVSQAMDYRINWEINTRTPYADADATLIYIYIYKWKVHNGKIEIIAFVVNSFLNLPSLSMIRSRSKYEADHLYWWYILFQVQWHICNQNSHKTWNYLVKEH